MTDATKTFKTKLNQIFLFIFSLENYDVDERLQKDIGDYIAARMARSRAIQANVTPMAATPSAIGGRPPTLQSPQSPDGSGGNDVTPTARFQRHLVSLARGSFLFVSLTLDLIERGHIVAKSASYKVLPQTLAEIFRLEFNLRFASCSAFRQVRGWPQKFISTMQCCGSGMFFPDPGSELFPSRFRVRIKEFKYFSSKIVFELLEI